MELRIVTNGYVIWHDKQCISMNFCNSFSPSLIIGIIGKIVNKLVNNRQMWLCMFVTIQNVERLNVSNAESLHHV